MQHRETILDAIARHVQCDPASLSASDALTDIGVDSLKFMVLMLEIESLLQRKIFTLDIVGKLITVGDVLALADK